MTASSQITIVNVGYRSTNYWVVGSGSSRLLVDIGWPGSMGMMLANLKRKDVPFSQIKICLATHYHIDHAGLAQEFKEAGVRLLVLKEQVGWIPKMKRWIKPHDNFADITKDNNLVTSTEESRTLLAAADLAGEILLTPGHSADSVSLLLDDGSAFTGDLTPAGTIGSEDPAVVRGSWQLLRERGADRIYPGHGPVRPVDSFCR